MLRLQPYRPLPREVYHRALVNGQLARGSEITNFQPGGRLNSLVEAIAEVLAERDHTTLLGFIAAIHEAGFAAFEFPRKPGAPATGLLRLDHSGHTNVLTFPPFTVDLFGQRFTTTQTGTIPPGETFCTVEAVATEIGTAGNIRARSIDTADGKGTLSFTLTPGLRVWNPADFGDGTNQESDESRLARWHAYIQNLGRAQKPGILAAALAVPGVVAAIVTTNTNPYTGLEETGWVNVYVTDGTASPPDSLLAEVRRVIEGVDDQPNYPGYAAGGADVFVGAITTFAVHVSYWLVLLAGSPLSDAEALSLADAAVIQYVNRLPIGQNPLPETIQAKLLTAHPDFYRVELLAPLTAPDVPANAVPRVGGAGGGTLSGIVYGREVPP